MRYHNGNAWTDSVSNNGVQGNDALNPGASSAPMGGTPTAATPSWDPSGLTSGIGDAAKQVNVDMLKTQPPYFFMIAGGAVLMFFGAFLPWAKATASFGGFGSSSASSSGFSAGLIGGTGTFLLSIALLAYCAIRLLKLESKLPPQTMQGLGFAALATSVLCVLFTVYRILDVMGTDDNEFIKVSVGIGLWISFLAAGVALAGSVMEFLATKKRAA